MSKVTLDSMLFLNISHLHRPNVHQSSIKSSDSPPFSIDDWWQTGAGIVTIYLISSVLCLPLLGETAAALIINCALFLEPAQDEVAGGLGAAFALVSTGGVGY